MCIIASIYYFEQENANFFFHNGSKDAMTNWCKLCCFDVCLTCLVLSEEAVISMRKSGDNICIHS